MTPLVQRAIDFATKAHAGQLRKGAGDRPYIVHPLSVMNRLRRHGVADEVTLAAAVLHDVVEDCAVLPEILEAEFGGAVASVVVEVSDPPGLSKNQAKKRQLAHAPTMSLRARLIKICDKTDNVDDVGKHPPGWAPAAIRGYVESSRAIVLALGLDAPAYSGLQQDFREAAQRALESIECAS
jgi:guanosine-3',5'-bis(diphosphate) 3'-pyrophosphohydrolase